MYNAGEFVAIPMRLRVQAIRVVTVLAAFGLSAFIGASGQDSSSGPSLGDAARKARTEHAAAKVLATHVVDSDDDGPDSSGVWRIRMCFRTPCYNISVILPKSPRWTRAPAAPRPVLIPLLGPEDDPNRVIRVYAAAIFEPYAAVDASKINFLQGWFARPEYFGHAAHIAFDEHLQIDGHYAAISHFSVTGGTVKYRGVSVIANTPNGNGGFACVYRDQDAGGATSICDAIVKSASDRSLAPAAPKVYPAAADPADPQNDDPADDPPGDDDPQ